VLQTDPSDADRDLGHYAIRAVSISVSIQGLIAKVTYAGPQGAFPGVLLPGTLAGAGDITVR
jgi:hypothetical protein